ncbi:MAG: MazG nucleotide pyrophosphohydrolase domain-containing protein [Candidatus Hodarchaeales archaeon]|jgi:NTP pyrophosphatase (non-canonical NTP hydrolase)
MSFGKLVEGIDTFIANQGGYWNSAWMLAALTEELGELSRTLQSYEGLRKQNNSITSNNALVQVEEEIGDLLFALICLTNSLGLNLKKAGFTSLNKYITRASVLNDADR